MASAFGPNAATDTDLPHDSLVTHIIGICSAMLVLVTIVVGARFWVRFKLVKGRAGVDDWCILVAWVLAAAYDLGPINRKYLIWDEDALVFSVGSSSSPISSARRLIARPETKFGLGQHIYDLPPETNSNASLQVNYTEEQMGEI